MSRRRRRLMFAAGVGAGGGGGGSSPDSYLYLPNTNGNVATTPNDPVNDLDGDIEMRARIAVHDFTDLGDIMGKWGTAVADDSFLWLIMGDGKMQFYWGENVGGPLRNLISDDALSTIATEGEYIDLRVQFVLNSGVPSSTVDFGYKAATGSLTDDAGWTAFGSQKVLAGGPRVLNDSASTLTIGGQGDAWNEFNANIGANIKHVVLYDGVGGTIVFEKDFTGLTDGDTTTTDDANGKTITIQQSGTPQAAIVGDITVPTLPLVAHVRAEDVTTGGGDVDDVVDNHGGYTFAATGANRPTLDEDGGPQGRPAFLGASGDGLISTDAALLAALSGNVDVSVAALFKEQAADAEGNIAGWGLDSDADYFRFTARGTDTKTILRHNRSGGSESVVAGAGGDFTADTWTAILYQYNSATGEIKIYVENVEEASGTVTAGSVTAEYVALMCGQGFSQNFVGQVSEVLYLNDLLTVGERTDLQTYFNNRRGL